MVNECGVLFVPTYVDLFSFFFSFWGGGGVGVVAASLSLVDGFRLFRAWYCVQGVVWGVCVCGLWDSFFAFSIRWVVPVVPQSGRLDRCTAPSFPSSLAPSLPLLVSIAPPPFSCLDHRSLLFLRCACWDEWIEMGTGRRRGQAVTVLTYLHGVKEAQVRSVLFCFD